MAINSFKQRKKEQMPQMNKGGKYIFGRSVIRNNGFLTFPTQAIDEYQITSEGKIILFTGSKSTGGFCVTRKYLLSPSQLGFILKEQPELCSYAIPEGEFVAYKGRAYCWLSVTSDGIIRLDDAMLSFLSLSEGMSLLSIRSSNIAFTMGAKGPLLQKAAQYDGVIPEY